ncbi:hypothetical protein EST38_g11470 [Candolleomyces aberdarensis]|uniref:Uncharacterized protein n=1 Tax=Candolleomyces aberdarensis TaxID=2316362 RepID=A0A4Q2D7H3_9AGAR|nr:hypothetical protein EST38_g11470 [Candolleomyces aberdarensis]
MYLVNAKDNDLIYFVENSAPKRPTTVSSLGWGFRKIVYLFTDVHDLVALADQHEHEKSTGIDLGPQANPSDEEAKEYCEMVKLECLCAYQSVQIFSRFIPNFAEAINNPKPEEVKQFLTEIQCGDGAQGLMSTSTLMTMLAVGYSTTSVVDSCAPSSMIGMIPRYGLGPLTRALYAGYDGLTTNVEAGYLKSPMLIKAYRHIFTSPASVQSVNSQDDENNAPCPKKSRKVSRKNVASTLQMKNQVTSWPIAYAPVQLLFALSSAPHWTDEYEGLNFKNVYYHIVDFFENVDGDLESKKTAQDLLKWWNQQIFPEAQPLCVNTARSTAQKLLEEQRAACCVRAALSGSNV